MKITAEQLVKYLSDGIARPATSIARHFRCGQLQIQQLIAEQVEEGNIKRLASWKSYAIYIAVEHTLESSPISKRYIPQFKPLPQGFSLSKHMRMAEESRNPSTGMI